MRVTIGVVYSYFKIKGFSNQFLLMVKLFTKTLVIGS